MVCVVAVVGNALAALLCDKCSSLPGRRQRAVSFAASQLVKSMPQGNAAAAPQPEQLAYLPCMCLRRGPACDTLQVRLPRTHPSAGPSPRPSTPCLPCAPRPPAPQPFRCIPPRAAAPARVDAGGRRTLIGGHLAGGTAVRREAGTPAILQQPLVSMSGGGGRKYTGSTAV